MSSYRGLDLFGSGPHRTRLLVRKIRTLPVYVVLPGSTEETGLIPVGNGDYEIEVVGRLIAGTEAALWSLRSAIMGQIDETLGDATLVDTFGRSWTKMRLTEYLEADRVDRGRSWSVGYTATFRWFEFINTA